MSKQASAPPVPSASTEPIGGGEPPQGGISRRQALQQMGLGLGALAVGCTPAEPGMLPGPAGPGPGGSPEDPEPKLSPQELLAGIDTVIVLMMENRSFDHYLGSLRTDSRYLRAAEVEGLTGTESNPDPFGTPVRVFRTVNRTPLDPPHGWDECHRQWNGGKNDGFVKVHAVKHGGIEAAEVMGYHDRASIPFYYALCDRYTVCQRWFSSAMGPTWPNRFYLHAATSGGKRDNSPFLSGGPPTVWERLKDKAKHGKNYADGIVAWYTGGFAGKALSGNTPVVDMDVFFTDARTGKLPPFAVIDPDFMLNDDHPSHDIRFGQAFMASIVQALAQSPQWSRSLLIITYDEHGGFYDHVPPPTTYDEAAGFEQLGFRVPTLVIGPTVRRGAVNSVIMDHVSVAATLATRYGIRSLNRRMDMTSDVSSCIDPRLVGKPEKPPEDLPRVQLRREDLASALGRPSSQPELVSMVRSGQIPERMMNPMPPDERLGRWLERAQALGAVDVMD